MSAVHTLSAVRRELVRLGVVAEAATADPSCPPSVAAHIVAAEQELREAAWQLRRRLDRAASGEDQIG